MQTDRRERISALYHAALACAPQERRAFVIAAADGDDVLRQEVESLLACDPASLAFLEQPAAALLGSALLEPDLVGHQVGQYTIVALLGAGGMGEVYRAHDGKLGRDVAIKMLPVHSSADPERRARFAREARLLATLNHPNIGAIYGLEEVAGQSALILELVEGMTLAERLGHGRLSIADAVAIARQIAAALAAAHDQRIVHRDLKPANVVLQGLSGTTSPASALRARVLDFGLAKSVAAAIDPPSPASESAASDRTVDGRILGTPAYMSPEQARGEVVDRRADIWAFGCVLFEMLAGKRPFDGQSAAETLAAVLTQEPDWASVPRETPPAVRAVLRRCLRKDPDRRLHDMADARIELDEASGAQAPSHDDADLPPSRLRRRPRLGWIAAAVLALFAGGLAVLTRWSAGPSPVERLEFALALPAGSRFIGSSPEFAISPDGRFVAFTATSKATSALWVHSLSTLEVVELPGTDGARNPFWSPNGRSLGFFANDQLKTVQVTGGSPVALCPAPGTGAFSIPHSGAWSSRGVILFAGRDGLRQVNATGGPSSLVVSSTGNTAWPSFLPNGEHFLYTNCCSDEVELRLGSMTTRETTALGVIESHVQYAAGHLFFVRGGNLLAQRFDEGARRLAGEPLHLGVQVGVNPAWDRGVFSVSASGRLVYRATARALSQLTWLDRRGLPVGTFGEPAVINNLALSPDSQRLAVAELSHQPGSKPQFDIWVRDLTTGKRTRLTDDRAWEFAPAWSPDGAHVAFMSNRPMGSLHFTLFLRPSNGSGDDVPFITSPSASPTWGRHGFIVYESNGTDGTGADLWTASMSGDRTFTVFLKTRYQEVRPKFSPDGRWVAYQSNATGRDEVYLRPFPSRDPSHRVSLDGGLQPRWRKDGKELFFLSPDGTLMAARVDLTTRFVAGVPEALFPTAIPTGKDYVVWNDGQRFLIPLDTHQPLRVVTDWRGLLTR